MSDLTADKREDRPVWWKRPVVIGWIATAIVLVVFCGAMSLRDCVMVDGDSAMVEQCQRKWAELRHATPNEIGDTLAGVAGALAFIWIIVTVALQSQELAAQRAELRLTRAEAKRTADALAEQVNVMQIQAEVFEDGLQQRQFDRAKDVLEQRLIALCNACTVESQVASLVEGRENWYEGQLHVFGIWSGQEVDTYLKGCSEAMQDFLRGIHYRRDWSQNRRFRGPADCYHTIVQKIDLVLGMRCSVSHDQVLRIENLGIPELKRDLISFVEADYWDVPTADNVEKTL